MKPRPTLRRALPVLLAALALTGCHDPAPTAATSPQRPAATIRAQTVQNRPRLSAEEIVGTVRARIRGVIEAKISGRIERMPVRVGQRVQAGDLLVELNAREINAQLDQANALLRQADRELERFGALLKQEAATQAEYDAVESRHRIAAAGLDEAKTMLGYARLEAPFDGLVTRKLAEVGDLATPGRPLLEMEDPTTLRFEADVPETLLQRIQPGGHLTVTIPTLGATGIAGTVSEVAPSADAGSRTFRVKLDLPATDGLMAGQFGRVAVPVNETRTLRAPSTSVVVRGQMELVFVVTNQIAQLRLVKTGKVLGDEVELLSGVSDGEQVVVEGATGLVDGQPVQVK